MIFRPTSVSGVVVIEPQRNADERGFFARAYCAEEFRAHGLIPSVAQCNISVNHRQGTFRGLHWQVPRAREAKFIRCVSGAIYDVVVDTRAQSPTYLHHLATELTAENQRSVYIPEMFAHGYLAVSDGATALYSVSESYTPGCEFGIRFDDPLLRIKLPLQITCISEKDRSWPDFEASAHPEKLQAKSPGGNGILREAMSATASAPPAHSFATELSNFLGGPIGAVD